ncbi:MAG: hypothetical protein JJU01_09165 [Alkalibacterium sp.]|nr:hypothetical protein [Alkalibacterium sp.]
MRLFIKRALTVSSICLLAACQGVDDNEVEQPEENTAAASESDTEKDTVDATTEATADINIRETEREWSAQPELDLVKGDYYKTEERFRQGHMGTFELVEHNGDIVHVQFDEMTRPNYYNRFYQDVPKRLSEYNFDMGEKKGAAWIESVVLVESQMLNEQRITGDFDVVSGASNSIEQSMLPLAEVIDDMRNEPTSQYYYGLAEDLGDGLTAYLKVILDEGKITDVRYDEIFADDPEQIEDYELKQFYRQSKYQSVLYDEPSRIGFNVQMDALRDKVIETQDLLDLTELPAIDESGDYQSAGFTIRNESWDNYLRLAETIQNELEADGHF